jgi:hypothetical protein
MFAITIFEDLNELLPCKEGKFVPFYKSKQTPKLKNGPTTKKTLHMFLLQKHGHITIK